MNFALSPALLCREAQEVIGLRRLKLARGGAIGQREAQLMVTEKRSRTRGDDKHPRHRGLSRESIYAAIGSS